MNSELFTVGHSTHTVEHFTGLLKQHSITAVCDVRSQPYSKYNPQFNREEIKEELKKHNIAYVFLGKELGARSENPECYIDGTVQFDLVAKDESFKRGIDRLTQGMERYLIALMCAEKDPIICHRTILVCRAVRSQQMHIKHILADGEIETHSETEDRLLRECGIKPDGLFEIEQKDIERAYDKQGQKIAYIEKEEQVATS